MCIRDRLKDVVVVGYGVQKKVNLTGAVSSLSTDELEGKPIANVLEAMQGTTPGLVIQQGTSTPVSYTHLYPVDKIKMLLFYLVNGMRR